MYPRSHSRYSVPRPLHAHEMYNGNGRPEVIKTVAMNNTTVSWDLTQCNLVEPYRRNALTLSSGIKNCQALLAVVSFTGFHLSQDKNLSQDSGVFVETRTGHLPNTNQKCFRLSQLCE